MVSGAIGGALEKVFHLPTPRKGIETSLKASTNISLDCFTYLLPARGLKHARHDKT